jgi:hypothetical protein
VLVDGKPLSATVGTEGAAWHWQDGGTVKVSREAKVALHDLTGCEGRCDAIVFSRNSGFTPPNDLPALAALRRQALGLPEAPEDGGSYYLIIVGGGIAGTSAAMSAARLGLRVALLQDRPVLGGNNSSEMRVWLNGGINLPPYPRVGDIVAELEPKQRAHIGTANSAEIYEDERRLALVRNQPNLTLLLEQRVNAVAGNDQLLLPVLGHEEVARVSMNAFPGKGQRGAARDQANRPIAQGHNADSFGCDGLDEFGDALMFPVTRQRRATGDRSVEVRGFDDGSP